MECLSCLSVTLAAGLLPEGGLPLWSIEGLGYTIKVGWVCWMVLPVSRTGVCFVGAYLLTVTVEGVRPNLRELSEGVGGTFGRPTLFNSHLPRATGLQPLRGTNFKGSGMKDDANRCDKNAMQSENLLHSRFPGCRQSNGCGRGGGTEKDEGGKKVRWCTVVGKSGMAIPLLTCAACFLGALVSKCSLLGCTLYPGTGFPHRQY